MLLYSDYLPEPMEKQLAFILDHGKIESDGQLKYADDAKSYGWNIHQNGKLEVGSVVLNRHPGKITKDRKWEIYGGGYISSISEPDDDGNVTAEISHAFKIEPPIRQGDSFIENFKWSTPSKKKLKKPNSWSHFWNQYGINEISYDDFVALINNRPIIPIDNLDQPVVHHDLTNTELDELKQNISKDFTVLVEEDALTPSTNAKKCKFIGRKTDWDRIYKSKQKIGAIGEEIVFDLLEQKANKNGFKQPEHVSKTEGDGLGYDIRAWDEEGKEIHIEVKTSTSKFSDGFEMTSNEVEASRGEFPYKIYFVYGLKVASKECKIKVYNGPINEDVFKLIPSSYKIFLK